ncbi:MAG: hypothetical protein LBM16_04790 [Clostridiales bacterium]|nr:hypothetical protein [Clostridiales bacterium]
MSENAHLFIIDNSSLQNYDNINNLVLEIHKYFCFQKDVPYKIENTNFPREPIGIIHQYREKFPSSVTLRVYAIGGDDTLFACVQGVVYEENTCVVPMPFGRNNSLAEKLGMGNIQKMRSVEYSTKMQQRLISAMHCGHVWGISFCSVGIIASADKSDRQMIYMANNQRQLAKTIPILMRITHSKILYAHKPLAMRYRVTIDDYDIHENIIGVDIANATFRQGLLTQNCIDVWLVNYSMRKEAMKFMWDCYNGDSIQALKKHKRIKAKHILIEADEPFDVCLDGEFFREKRLDITWEEKRLSIAVPKESLLL